MVPINNPPYKGDLLWINSLRKYRCFRFNLVTGCWDGDFLQWWNQRSLWR